MTINLSTYITEAFREVQTQQEIDVDNISSQPKTLPSALPSMYSFLTSLSDVYNGPTEYYADDETLDVFDNFFSKNKDYRFIVSSEKDIKDGIDFFVKTKDKKYSFKILLSSDEVRLDDCACIIPYKEDGKIALLENNKIDYFIWKVPNRNSFFTFEREKFFKDLADVNFDKHVKIQNVKDKKSTQVIRFSNSALNAFCNSHNSVYKHSTLSSDVYIGDDLKVYIEEIKEKMLRK